MAIYDLTVSTGSHAGGHSAAAKDEYIEREGRYDEDRSEVEHSESGHMPEWAEDDAHTYWEAADEHERVNGAAVPGGRVRPAERAGRRGAPGAGARVRPVAHRQGAVALHLGDPPGPVG